MSSSSLPTADGTQSVSSSTSSGRKATLSSLRRQRRRAILDIDCSPDRESLYRTENTTGVEGFDELPEEVRSYLNDSPFDWSPRAVALRIRMVGIEGTIEFLQAADTNRVAAFYDERGAASVSCSMVEPRAPAGTGGPPFEDSQGD